MAVYTSVKNGWWDDPATWDVGGSVPTNGHTAIIEQIVGIRGNVTVGTDAGATVDCILFNANNAKLIWGDPAGEIGGASPVSGDWTLTLKGIIEFAVGVTGAVFQVGTAAYPIPEGRTATIDHAGSTGFTHYVRAGKIRVHGFPSYHMTASNNQRTSLAVNSAAGTAQITVKDAVDWEAGDFLWLGTGGDPTQAPTSCEQVTILNRVNSYTYNLTGNLVNNHFGGSIYGDLVIHASRNVIFKSSTSNGYTFRSMSTTEASYDINWARFESAGYSTTYGVWNLTGAANDIIPTDNYIFRNNIYDTPDVPDNVNTEVFDFSDIVLEEDKTFTNISENHGWNWGNIIDLSTVRGRLNFGHVSSFYARQYGINGSTTNDIHLKGFWYICDTPTNVDRTAYSGPLFTLEDFKIHSAWAGLYCAVSIPYISGRSNRIKNGEIFHINSTSAATAGFYTDEIIYCGKLIIDNVKFYGSVTRMFHLGSGGVEVYVKDCTFDNLNTTDTDNTYPIYLGVNYGLMYDVRFDNCDFGLESRNYRHNISMLGSFVSRGAGRVIFSDCRFKEPINYVSAVFDWMADEIIWAFAPVITTNWKDWRVRGRQPGMVSFEFVDCEIQNNAGVDQWSTLFPNTDVMAFIAQGAEIHKTHPTNEANGYIDGTFQRKILPFLGTIRLHATRAVPIRIPVNSGQTVSVTLSLKKNVSQLEDDRPRLHLEGCGIKTYETMSDGIGTWEALTVSGVTSNSGTVLFWVSCMGVPDIHDPLSPPVRTFVGVYNYCYPIDPGGTGTGIGTPDNLILYCDKLQVTRS